MIKFIRILDKLTIASLLHDYKAVLARVILVPGTERLKVEIYPIYG